ncbi:MAG: citramalate synthase [Proteobacteria bacterium]|nr:citramalate synthase [Pseudomonadota bacterium]
MKQIRLYDATLREGNQTEDISFSLEDKLRITQRLDELGMHYIEGGWPGSNPKDLQYFKDVKKCGLKNAIVTAFGSTAKPGAAIEHDRNLNDLINARTEAVTIFGKSWDIHIKSVLRIGLDENLRLIEESLAYLKKHVPKVFFDAEHFFDGYKAHPDYAMGILRHGLSGGADCLVLCDTNGGTLPHEIHRITSAVRKEIDAPLGIHAHNDSDLAVANSLAAVACGCMQVQGTINGCGERCGNANLCSVIPNLKIKMGFDCVSDEQLRKISGVSRFVYELANLPHNKHQPFVGASAFAHKAGVHVSAVKRRSDTYEHIPPELVGNTQRILVSDQSGRANILQKAKEFNIDIASHDPLVQEILADLKDLERHGFQFEGAEASFELRMRKALGEKKRYFDLVGFRVTNEKKEEGEPLSEATIMVKVGGAIEHTAAMGNGPVNALDNALRKALEKFYPELKQVHLIDYKVRVLTGGEGTASKVRVLIETGDRRDSWGTVGVSENIIEASWQALTDSITYKLLKDEIKGAAE